ncbi:MAG TPA: hypothetical protein VF899_06015 [Pyrinomonadaceae bacterium]
MPIHAFLILLSTLIIFLLGALHLLLTFRGTSFYPRDRELVFKMKAVSPLISTQTTMWKAAIGFHASHSIGTMLFSVVYMYLALEPTRLLFQSTFLLGVGLVYLALLVTLCRLYWLRLPFAGMLLATFLYAGAIIANVA